MTKKLPIKTRRKGKKHKNSVARVYCLFRLQASLQFHTKSPKTRPWRDHLRPWKVWCGEENGSGGGGGVMVEETGRWIWDTYEDIGPTYGAVE